MKRQNKKHPPRRLGVDLSPLLPLGANGGVKPLIFQSLKIVREQLGKKATFVFFVNLETLEEVRSHARLGDRLVLLPSADQIPEISCTFPFFETSGDRYDPALLSRHGVDVLYCPFGSVDLAQPGIPTVACIVDLIHIDYPASLSSEEIFYRRNYLSQTMRVSDALNCISLHVVERVLTCYPDYQGDIFFTYNTVQQRLSEIPDSPRPIPCDHYFFYPSNFWPHKNHEVLLVAYRNYLSRTGSRPWALVLTGAESERTEIIRRYAETLGIADHVHFLGYVDEPYLKKLWQASSALVFPSLHEGFGIPLLEAMRFEKPIISSSACCLPEVAQNACLQIDPRKPLELAEALLTIQSSSKIRKELVARGKTRLEAFNTESEMLKLSETLLHTEAMSVWNKGIYADGWMGRDAILGIPAITGEWTLELVLTGRDRPTQLTIRISDFPFGTHEISMTETTALEIRLIDPSHSVHLSIPDPTQLSEADERFLGARILSATLKNTVGESHTLFRVE